MAWRFYLVPTIGQGSPITDPRRPKYINHVTTPTIRWRAMHYGLEPVSLLAADLTGGQHTALVANSDVVSIPTNIDATISAGALTAVQTNLAALNIPSEWVTTAHTYRDVLRLVGKVFQVAQRLRGRFGHRLFESGITLTTTLSQLTQNQRDHLVAAADSFGIDTSQATGATTIRTCLRVLAQQLPPFGLALETF